MYTDKHAHITDSVLIFAVCFSYKFPTGYDNHNRAFIFFFFFYVIRKICCRQTGFTKNKHAEEREPAFDVNKVTYGNKIK